MKELEELLYDSHRKTADMAVGLVGNDQKLFDSIIDFALQDNGVFSMRAARVANLTALAHPQLIRPHLNKLVRRLDQIQNDGLKRGIAKTISESPFDYDDETMGVLADICFKWVNNSNEKVAVKVYAMDILYRLSEIYPEIRSELISCLEIELPRESNAIKSRANKYLKKLYKDLGVFHRI